MPTIHESTQPLAASHPRLIALRRAINLREALLWGTLVLPLFSERFAWGSTSHLWLLIPLIVLGSLLRAFERRAMEGLVPPDATPEETS